MHTSIIVVPKTYPYPGFQRFLHPCTRITMYTYHVLILVQPRRSPRWHNNHLPGRHRQGCKWRKSTWDHTEFQGQWMYHVWNKKY